MRTKVVIANWKMNKTLEEALRYVKSLAKPPKTLDVAIAPPAVFFAPIHEVVKSRRIDLIAQTMSEREEGAFTGEISAIQLKGMVKGVLLGHSEQRAHHGETDESVAKKRAMALRYGLTPILCFGESREVREDGSTMKFITQQCERMLDGLSKSSAIEVVLAYEPLWAISGQGALHPAKPEEVQDVHRYVRNWLARRFDERLSEKIRILYGGSVSPETAADFRACPDVDGALVGSASLNARSFESIISSFS